VASFGATGIEGGTDGFEREILSCDPRGDVRALTTFGLNIVPIPKLVNSGGSSFPLAGRGSEPESLNKEAACILDIGLDTGFAMDTSGTAGAFGVFNPTASGTFGLRFPDPPILAEAGNPGFIGIPIVSKALKSILGAGL